MPLARFGQAPCRRQECLRVADLSIVQSVQHQKKAPGWAAEKEKKTRGGQRKLQKTERTRACLSRCCASDLTPTCLRARPAPVRVSCLRCRDGVHAAAYSHHIIHSFGQTLRPQLNLRLALLLPSSLVRMVIEHHSTT